MLRRYGQRHPGSSIAQIVFYDLCRESALLVLRMFYRHTRIDVRKVPSTGSVLMVANHVSFLDPPTVAAGIRHRQTDFLARGGLFHFKLFGWLIKQLNSTPIKQGSGDAGAMKATLKKLAEGKMMLVFPEGSRSDDGDMHEFQRGVAVLLKRAHCQVVPVGIAGAYEAWPRKNRLPRIFTKRIVVCYGDPIPSDELIEMGTEQALSTLHDRVQQLVIQAHNRQ